MHPVIVITELDLLPPEERWSRLVAPLQAALEEGGLGRVLDYDALRQETAACGFCPAVEVSVELRHREYGREQVEFVVAATGVARDRPVLPRRWLPYGCQEYFRAGWAETGYFDTVSQTPVIVPFSEVYEDATHEFLVIGHSGGDGIDFGYRRGQGGLWAYPVDGEYRFMAGTVAELVHGWSSGRLTL